MSEKLKPRISTSEEFLSTGADEKPLLNPNFSNSFHSPYEIFRNNTTAVEVIVKEIIHKGKKQIITNVDKKNHNESATIKRLDGDIKKLRNDLHDANSNLEETQRCFKVILCEMKKQLDEANQRELQTETKNLALQLEKEKLKALLDSKSNLVTKLKKEFTGIKRMLKVVVKGIRCTPVSPMIDYHSDIDYDEFEKDLKNSALLAGNCSNNEKRS